ncbi:MAG: hypothetical protein ACEY3L_14540 [Wolbachia sp.]
MLKKIKEFFKWIAGRIASVWNSIKNLWSGQSDQKILTRKDVMTKLINGKANFSFAIVEDNSKRLVIHIRDKDILESLDWRNINYEDPSKYRVCVKRDKDIFKITYSELVAVNNNFVSFIVNSVDDGKTSSCELEGMKKMLGLNSNREVSIIEKISQKPEVVSSTSKVPASDSKVLSSEAGKPSKLLDNLSREQLMKSKLIIPTF